MNRPETLDVSELPEFAFGSRSILWWATICLVAIEGTVFALAIASYYYLQGNEPEWPTSTLLPPALLWGVVNLILLLVSTIPNQWVKKKAESLDQEGCRRGLILMSLFGLVFLGIRALEFGHLNVSWDSNAYGSITWTLLGLHTAHLLTDVVDTIVLAVLGYTHGVEGKRFVDISENAEYWYFVILSWVPIWFVIYISPRVL